MKHPRLISTVVSVAIMAAMALQTIPVIAIAATTAAQPTQTLTTFTGEPNLNITSSNFQLTVCDGPNYPGGNNPPISVPVYDSTGKQTGTTQRAYVPCDFNAMMKEIQHLINIATVVGVLIAIFGFCYAGYLYIVGGSNPSKRSQANDAFKKIGIGFIIMLSAWFIVYQILSWLTGNSGFGALLGKPS